MKYQNVIKLRLPPGDFSACFAFSVHKCGSSLMHKMINDVCQLASLPCLNIPEPMFNNGVQGWDEDEAILKYIKDGYIYFGFRMLPPVFEGNVDFSRSRNVLLVRDPRDALVSQYFSFRPGGSHVLPSKNIEKFLARENTIGKTMTIDSYVLQMAENIKNKLLAYRPLVESGNIKVFKYEDIFYNKSHFLGDIFNHFEIEVDKEIIKDVAIKHDVVPVVEDRSKHIRKGAPGDHKDKLKPRTIAKLNEVLSDVAELYNYDFVSQPKSLINRLLLR